MIVYDVSSLEDGFPTPPGTSVPPTSGVTGDELPVSVYLWGARPDELLADVEMGQGPVDDWLPFAHWYTSDHQGSIRNKMDDVGNRVGVYAYDAFGRLGGGVVAQSTGAGLADGEVDPNWTVDDDDDPQTAGDPTYVVSEAATAWVAGKFVSPNAGGTSTSQEDWFYETTVTSLADGGTITGYLSADNEVVEIYVNGNPTGISTPGNAYTGWHEFTLAGLDEGENNVTFWVKDYGEVTGLAVRWGGEGSRFLYTGQEHDRETGNETGTYLVFGKEMRPRLCLRKRDASPFMSAFMSAEKRCVPVYV